MIYREIEQDEFIEYLEASGCFDGWERFELEQLFEHLEATGDDIELCAYTLSNQYQKINPLEGLEIAEGLGMKFGNLYDELNDGNDPFDRIEAELEKDHRLFFTFTNDGGDGIGFCLYR
jgi:hypothetical protein